MPKLRTLAAAALLTGAATFTAAVPHAAASTTYYVVEGQRTPVGCCSAGDSLHELMWPPTAVGGVSAATRCANRGGSLWAQNFGNGYVYLWCLNIDF